MKIDFNQVIGYYRAITSDEINYREFIVALLIAERGFMINSPEDIKPEEVQKLANAVEYYVSIFDEGLNEDIDEIINNPRNNYYDDDEDNED